MRGSYKASFALAQVRHSLCIYLCGATTLGRYLDLSEVMAMPLGLDLDLLLLEQGQLSMPLPLMLPRSLQSLSGLCSCLCLVESIALKMLMMLLSTIVFATGTTALSACSAYVYGLNNSIGCCYLYLCVWCLGKWKECQESKAPLSLCLLHCWSIG